MRSDLLKSKLFDRLLLTLNSVVVDDVFTMWSVFVVDSTAVIVWDVECLSSILAFIPGGSE